KLVTGVQTCALPICGSLSGTFSSIGCGGGKPATLQNYAIRQEKDKSTNPKYLVSSQLSPFLSGNLQAKTRRSARELFLLPHQVRSEERREGKECRDR